MKKATVYVVAAAIFAMALSACVFKPYGLAPEYESSCTDGKDNDHDGFVDCLDYEDCGADPACQLDNDCGNSTLDATEVCDDGNNIDGDGCTADCSACEGNLIPNGVGGCLDPALCGDGNLDEGEECDDEGESEDCNSNCTFAACGDSILNETANEFCDDGGDTAECDADCSIPSCGDGHHNDAAGEDCDTSGESATCNDDCTVPACGDGNVNEEAGEDCDASGESAQCNDDCSLSVCGDGNVNESAGEVCDDGNTDPSDGCSANCLSDETCGNGITDGSEGEVCDDGNNLNGDGCSANCFSDETCGNGTFDTTEVCDGGTDCLPSCLCPEGKAPDAAGGCVIDASTCGDGIDNDNDGDTDCDDVNCGVIQITCNGGCNLFVVTSTTTDSQVVAPGVPVTVYINAAKQWARIYTYGRYVEAINDHGFLYWQPGVSQPAPFGTPGTPATTHSHDYGDAEWTNYSLVCLTPPPPPPPPGSPVPPRKHPLIRVPTS